MRASPERFLALLLGLGILQVIVGFGLLRSSGHLATGLLWLSIGTHIGWNFFQGPVFGFPASGTIEAHTLVSHQRVEPTWLSLGDFGPEASALMLPIIVPALVATRYWSVSAIRRGSGTAAAAL